MHRRDALSRGLGGPLGLISSKNSQGPVVGSQEGL